MDLPLWDSSDDQVACASRNNAEDHLLRHFSFVHGRDMLEEDALNEKSCVQVLKIWIDKADEDIVKLEEDILMLKCQLLWDDEDWSEKCSAVLREEIDHLDILLQSLEENRENGLQVETEELPPRLHDLLKPLLENYLSKPKQKQNAVTTEFNANAHTCPKDEVTENFISKPSTLDVHAESERSPDKSEPANPMVNESSVSTSIEKVNSREKQEKRNIEEKEEKSNNHSKALSKAGVIPGRLQHQSKVTLSHLKLNETGSEISETVEVDSMKQRTERSSKEQKARVYRRATKGDVLSVKPSVKMKGKNTKLSETPEAVEALETEMNKTPCSMNYRIEYVKMPRMELEHKVQVQKRREIETLAVNQAAKLISHLKPEDRGPQKKCQENPEAAESLQTETNRISCSINDRTEHLKKTTLELEHQVQVQQRRDIATVAVNQATKLISPLIPEGRGQQRRCKENPEAAEAQQTEMNRSPCSMNDRSEHLKRPRLELEHQVQVQQRRNILNMAANQAANLISPLKPVGRGPQITCQEIPEILQNSFGAEHVDKGPSSTENLMEQGKKGVAEGMSKNGKKEAQQQLNKIHIAGTSVVTATPILLPQEVSRLSFSPQTTCKKEDLTSSRTKLGKKEHDASNSTDDETADGKVILTCSNLKAIAKSRNLRGYSKLKKAELLKLLGFS